MRFTSNTRVLTLPFQTFPTSIMTNKPSKVTVSVDPAVLATSNGRGGAQADLLGSTSEGSQPSSALSRFQASAGAIAATTIGISLSLFLVSFSGLGLR